MIRVLIADDHGVVREGVRLLLQSDPELEVVGEAADGLSALEAAQGLKPDVVLMDLSMPGLSGLEATRRIRAAHQEVRVLILSMHEGEDYVRAALEAGASGYALKRSVGAELVGAIKAIHLGHTVLPPGMGKALLDHTASGRGGPETLSPREREVLACIARGMTNAEIAERLFISPKTVQAHRANIMEKLDLHDAVELTKYALRHGLIVLDDEGR